jgi:hypothetical protein
MMSFFFFSSKITQNVNFLFGINPSEDLEAESESSTNIQVGMKKTRDFQLFSKSAESTI